MSPVQSLILGIVQGFTEFLPVSSSGHLAILNLVFGAKDGGIDFSFFLHVATLLATFAYFWRDILEMLQSLLPQNKHMVAQRKTVLYIVVACLITGPIGLLIEPELEFMSGSLLFLGCAYIVTTVVLCSAEYFTNHKARLETENLGPLRAAGVGLAQGLAVIPGVSRSGSTIAGGMAMGLSREAATRFSFLLGMPIIIVGALKDGIDLAQGQIVLPSFWVSVIGFVAAAVSGYIAIAWMIKLVKHVKLYWFALYTGLLGIGLIVYALVVG